MEYLQLVAGFVLLVLSGDFLVRGGVSLAKHFNVSTMVIGVTIVSLGTSLPELFVSAQAALNGHPEISVGNVVGSNIANIALVLALTCIIFPLWVKKSTLKFDTPFMIGASLLFMVFIFDGVLTHFEGLIFIALLIGFIYYTFYKSSKNKQKNTAQAKYSLGISIAIIMASSVGLRYGADWLVKSVSAIAANFNVSETVISVTIIAFGTSVPELVTSGVAALKKEPDISVGNIIGSNIFNLFGVLGITGIIKKIPISEQILNFHQYWMIGIAVLLLILILPIFQVKMNRWKGVLFFSLYIIYIYLIFKLKLY